MLRTELLECQTSRSEDVLYVLVAHAPRFWEGFISGGKGSVLASENTFPIGRSILFSTIAPSGVFGTSAVTQLATWRMSKSRTWRPYLIFAQTRSQTRVFKSVIGTCSVIDCRPGDGRCLMS